MKRTNKIEFSNHGYERLMQRTNLKMKKDSADKMLKSVLKNGLHMRDFTEEERKFCKQKIRNALEVNLKVIKYKDLFFFFNHKNTCITVFPQKKEKSEVL